MSLKLIVGCMFSGKSWASICMLAPYADTGAECLLINSTKETRTSASRPSGASMLLHLIQHNADEILTLLKKELADSDTQSQASILIKEFTRLLADSTLQSSPMPYTHSPLLQDLNPLGRKSAILEKLHVAKVTNLSEIDATRYSHLLVDEAAFYPDLVEVVIRWVDVDKKHVIVAGLDGDYKRQPFGDLLPLVPHCDSIVKLTGWCSPCLTKGLRVPSIFTQKIAGRDKSEEHKHSATSSEVVNIDVGGKDKYVAVCRECYLIIDKQWSAISHHAGSVPS